MHRKADLVFDLDGTISDPLTGIHRSLNFALASHGLDEASEARVAELVGPPLDDAFRRLVPGADERQINTLVTKYRERYADVGYAENSLYPGVPQALGELTERGLALGVCTSKRADFAERILALFGLRQHFLFVDGGDIGIRKEQQLGSLSSAGLVGESSRMIGDRAVDVLAARANGLPSVGVLWGYGSESELREAGAGLLLHDVQELAWLARAT